MIKHLTHLNSIATYLLPAIVILFPIVANSQIQDSSDSNMIYKTLNYRGFSFEVPDFCTSEGSLPFIVKSPDSSFGVSLEIKDAQGADIKRCRNFCKDLSRTMHLKKSKIEDLRFQGFKGAVATGEIENQCVKAAVLVKGGKQINCIIMYTPSHASWAQHTLTSFK